MRFLCLKGCGEVLFLDENIDEDHCLRCPTCEGDAFYVEEKKE